jgi:hypothetical protein
MSSVTGIASSDELGPEQKRPSIKQQDTLAQDDAAAALRSTGNNGVVRGRTARFHRLGRESFKRK